MSIESISNLFRMLDWDTEHFGYKVARIEAKSLNSDGLQNILSALLKEKVKLVYWFIDPKDKISNKAAIENEGFLADEKVTYLTKVPPKMEPLQDENVKSYLKKPLSDPLKFLSLEAGVCSRYRMDPNCVQGEFERLYTEWIKKSLSGEIAKEVLVYKNKNKEVGFITLGGKNGRCNIGLIATDPLFRGKGIGKALMHVAFEKAVQWGYKEMDVQTQKANVGACKFYERCGFELESIVNIYHFWLNDA